MSLVTHLTGESFAGRPGGRFPGVASWQGGTPDDAGDASSFYMDADGVLKRDNEVPWIEVCRESYEFPFGDPAATFYAQARRRLGRRGLVFEEGRDNSHPAAGGWDFTHAHWTTRAANCNSAAAAAIDSPDEGGGYTYLLTATAPNGRMESNALGLDFSADSGAFSVWARTGQLSVGDHLFTVELNDGAGVADVQDFTITDQWRRCWVQTDGAFGAANVYARIYPAGRGSGQSGTDYDAYVALPQTERTDAGAGEEHEISSLVLPGDSRPQSHFSIPTLALPAGEWTLIYRFVPGWDSTHAGPRYLFSIAATAGAQNVVFCRSFSGNIDFYSYDAAGTSSRWQAAIGGVHEKDIVNVVAITRRQTRRYFWTYDVRYNGLATPHVAGPDPVFLDDLHADLHVGDLYSNGQNLAGVMHSLEVYDEALDPRTFC